MIESKIFVSVGGTATEQQEAFIRAVEDRLRSEGLVPHTVGRNTFSSDAPLTAVTKLLDDCVGTVVIALERTYFPAGIDKRGGPMETPLSEVRLPTAWNQIEAAMAYAKGHPLLMIVESGLRSEGLLERGNDWYVQSLKPDASSLSTAEFSGVLASWKQKVLVPRNRSEHAESVSDLTVGALLKGLRPSQLWSVLAALAALAAGAFALGGRLFIR